MCASGRAFIHLFNVSLHSISTDGRHLIAAFPLSLPISVLLSPPLSLKPVFGSTVNQPGPHRGRAPSHISTPLSRLCKLTTLPPSPCTSLSSNSHSAKLNCVEAGPTASLGPYPQTTSLPPGTALLPQPLQLHLGLHDNTLWRALCSPQSSPNSEHIPTVAYKRCCKTSVTPSLPC